ncbi:festuclavine dehydrogenase subunit FgaOx3 [Aspergillus udagawae]|uniref:Festuclavine dehydrogenase subunit FgaOx3 n=1 Tax=Aspergillus udagawae TaxID=91492 RepID=A0A8H3PBG4_9EURO|nr:festuclavine dehydrogenase subunit FgaOx3 [Aspergillus udagawae]
MSPLFTPIKVGRMTLQHRIAMAPMTRLRADARHVPLPSVKEYYQQRAAVPGTLLITEATVISPRHGGYPNVPGIFTDEHIAAWTEVTRAVHDRGSYIYLQLWALGRAANPSFLKQQGLNLISSSDVPMKSTFSDEMHHPKPLTVDGIHDAINDFAAAAKNAMRAGFDGVEIHGANGYLIDQFIQDVSNKRNDAWGGDVERRSMFAVEVTRAVVEAIGQDRTAIRLSPWSRYQNMRMEDPVPQFTGLVKTLAQYKLAYLHLCESDAKADGHLGWLLDAYQSAGPVIVAGNFNGETAAKALEGQYKGHNVAVAFGRPFIGNPDLAFRVKEGIPFAPYDPKTMYAQTAEGYTDYKYRARYTSGQPT